MAASLGLVCALLLGAQDLSLAPQWMFAVSPTGGGLENTARFSVPTGSKDGQLVYSERSLTGQGLGGGMTLVGLYKQFTLTEVLFGFPNTNHARLLGSITYLGHSWALDGPVEPTWGLGMALISTAIDLGDYAEVRHDDMGFGPQEGHALINALTVDNSVLALFPKVGLKVKLPWQHWHLAPFASLMYEHVSTRARSDGGRVTLYPWDPATGTVTSTQPTSFVDIRSFDTTSDKDYWSPMVGTDFLVDYHYFAQLRGKVYYNTRYDKWTVRLIGSLALTPSVGLSAYFEYTQKITVTNTYFLVGPTVTFLPQEFVERLQGRRTAQKESTP